MGQLTPNTTYIYERANGVIYARESGAHPSTRVVIGYDYDPITGHKIPHELDPRTVDGRPLRVHIQENKMWGDIRRAAATNPTLQDTLDYAIMVYNLSKRNE